MKTKTELYRREDPGDLKKKYVAWLAVVWVIAAAALAACVLFCVFTDTANAGRMEGCAIAVFTAAGWVDIYLATFVVASLARERAHAERMLEGERKTIQGRTNLAPETIRIRKSISVRRVTVVTGEEKRQLYVDAARSDAMERALGGGEKLCQLDLVGGYVAAFVVCDENS